MATVDYSQLFEMASLDADEEEHRELDELYAEARRYISSFPWHGEVRRVLFGLGIGRIVGVFLFELVPISPKIDSALWVIVGDLPPAYLVTDKAPTPDLALEVYIREVRRWIEAVKIGTGLADTIPVNVPATLDNAADLESRLNFLETKIIPWYRQSLDLS